MAEELMEESSQESSSALQRSGPRPFPPSSSSSSSTLQLPLARVKATIKSDPDITLTSQEATLLIAKATELFIGHIVRHSYTFTVQGKRKTVQRRDMDACIPKHDELAFLEGTLDS